GGPGAPGLHFDLLHLDELTIDSTDSPKLPFLLIMKQPGEDPNAKGGGAVDLLDVSLSARIEKWGPDEKHDKDQPLKRIVVDKLVIERIEAEGLSVWFPGYGALVRVPTQEEYKGTDPLPPRAFIRHVELAGGDTAKVFEYVPGAKGHILG